eukprot:CAMPEP_0115129844 /NCGR_PEP_ID=MMETSP0227-20121206/52061_1 /TAXON_ID=89957 /ORGANISM="Polarella glacialis, Strain CCMP 1383" /LENGTH=110 /DNA_ID=CAMNT_0002534847 /DNA_START=1279 /DNA_END=1611 /DNA_ORIENTATION=-
MQPQDMRMVQSLQDSDLSRHKLALKWAACRQRLTSPKLAASTVTCPQHPPKSSAADGSQELVVIKDLQLPCMSGAKHVRVDLQGPANGYSNEAVVVGCHQLAPAASPVLN